MVSIKLNVKKKRRVWFKLYPARLFVPLSKNIINPKKKKNLNIFPIRKMERAIL